MRKFQISNFPALAGSRPKTIGVDKLKIKNGFIQHQTSGAGFTLIELVVYFGIFSILLLIFTNIFTSSIAAQLESESLSSVEQDSRYLLLKFSKDVTKASSIVIPAAPGDNSSSLSLVIDGQN